MLHFLEAHNSKSSMVLFRVSAEIETFVIEAGSTIEQGFTEEVLTAVNSCNFVVGEEE